jgi:hemerythrin-like domain-containing protein
VTIADAPIAAFDSVAAYLSWDHDRLDAILQSVRERVERGEWGEARREYGEFDRGLDRHIRLEEDILFPVFETRTGLANGPTAVMREEHRPIRAALGVMRDAIARRDAGSFHDGVAGLLTVLADHNAKEEHVLYPVADRVLPEADRAALAASLQRT